MLPDGLEVRLRTVVVDLYHLSVGGLWDCVRVCVCEGVRGEGVRCEGVRCEVVRWC